jgi:chemotaxis-related protein WspD
LITVSSEGHDWAVPVDQALAIHSLAESDMEPAPSTVARSSQAFLRGMFLWRERRVGLLDGDLVLGAIARRLA